MAETFQEHRIKLVYVGRFLNAKDQIRYEYAQIKEDTGVMELDDLGNNLLFKSRLKGSAVGVMFGATRTATGVMGPYDYLGHWQDLNQLGIWRAADEATYLQYQNTRKIKNIPKNAYDEAIENLTLIYWGLTPSQRDAFLFRVVAKIQGKK